jgi:hypothetical protein
MINNRLHSSLLFILIYSCFLSISCCKPDFDPCEGTPSQTFKSYLDDANKAKIPYSGPGKDTLIFVSNFGDTAKLYGQGKIEEMDVISVYSNANPDCGNMNYWYYEYATYNFVGNSSELAQLSCKYYVDHTVYQINTIEIRANNLNLAKATLKFINNSNNYNDSISINGNYIKGVNFNGDIYDSSLKVLYNYQYGILRLNFINEKTWIRKL